MELHLESFPLVPLIEDLAKTIEPMATKSGSRIVIACRPELWSGSILLKKILRVFPSKSSRHTTAPFPRDIIKRPLAAVIERAVFLPEDHVGVRAPLSSDALVARVRGPGEI